MKKLMILSVFLFLLTGCEIQENQLDTNLQELDNSINVNEDKPQIEGEKIGETTPEKDVPIGNDSKQCSVEEIYLDGEDFFEYDHPDAYEIYHLVVMVNYSDYKTDLDSDFFVDYFYGEESISRRIYQSTRGHVEIVPVKLPETGIEAGVVSVQLNIEHPNGLESYSFYPKESGEAMGISNYFQLIIDQLDEKIDFSTYDSNEDGYLSPEEFVVTLVQPGYITGRDRSPTSPGFSNRTEVNETGVKYASADGVNFLSFISLPEKISPGTSSNETVLLNQFLGTHEFGHMLKMPHVYDERIYAGDGILDPMGGALTDSNFSPWSLINAGLETPLIVSEDGEFTMYSRTMQDYNIIKIKTGDVYYLIENIDLLGYDRGLVQYVKNPGIAVWKIDETPIVHTVELNGSTQEFLEWPIFEGPGGRNSILLDGPDKDYLFLSKDMLFATKGELLYSNCFTSFYETDEFTLQVLTDTAREIVIRITFKTK